jgi:uncharacterized RDD family membrane protein YckC
MLDDTTSAFGGPAASFWRRLGAALIDAILLGIVNKVLQVILGTDAGYALGLLISLAYFTWFHGRTGQTPGDAALSIRVVDVRDRPGQPIGYGRAAGRWVVSIGSAIVILIGYFWMLWDPKKQTWHDKAVGSLPVYLGR